MDQLEMRPRDRTSDEAQESEPAKRGHAKHQNDRQKTPPRMVSLRRAER
jgi:hypothetical protein